MYMRSDRPPRAFVVDDDEALRGLFANWLSRAGFQPVQCSSAMDVISYFNECWLGDVPKDRVHVLVTDLRMPYVSGTQLLGYLRSFSEDFPVILVSSFVGDDEVRQARELGVAAVLAKPVTETQLVNAAVGALPPVL